MSKWCCSALAPTLHTYMPQFTRKTPVMSKKQYPTSRRRKICCSLINRMRLASSCWQTQIAWEKKISTLDCGNILSNVSSFLYKQIKVAWFGAFRGSWLRLAQLTSCAIPFYWHSSAQRNQFIWVDWAQNVGQTIPKGLIKLKSLWLIWAKKISPPVTANKALEVLTKGHVYREI